MKILISNDDGVLAPGLQVLAGAMSSLGDIEVIAPDRNRSGASNSLTLENPIRVKTMENGYHSVEGTPTDCVHIALTGLLDYQPDFVVSGINHGSNLGDDVHYSGTVAAAMEGRNMGVASIALSLVGDKHFQTAGIVAQTIIKRLQQQPPRPNIWFNVNIPDLPLAEIQGMQITRLGNRHKAERVQRMVDPRGREIYWIGAAGAEQDAGIGTDFYAIQQGYVSITPLQLDMTDYPAFEDLSQWLKAGDNALVE